VHSIFSLDDEALAIKWYLLFEMLNDARPTAHDGAFPIEKLQFIPVESL